MLYLVSTPIGNLGDVTYRAIQTLSSCDLVLCEDTRRTAILLKHYSISSKLVSFNEESERRKTVGIIEMLKEGKDVCLVSDSGTPLINDPGFFLVRECVRHGIQVSPIPGPSSILAGLSASGLPTDRFAFLGFVPKQPGRRQKFIQEISMRSGTQVMLESPYRLKKTLEAMVTTIPERRIVIARELTKKFEEFIRGTVEEVNNRIRGVKGEIVIVLEGK
jgi:16S rRNA (cytidine1402-2'-O)-methyltransferase